MANSIGVYRRALVRLAVMAALIAALPLTPAEAQRDIDGCTTAVAEFPRGTVWFAARANGNDCHVWWRMHCKAKKGTGFRTWPLNGSFTIDDGETAAFRKRCGSPRRTDATRPIIDPIPVGP